MSDNARPMLYGARYEAAIASRPLADGDVRCHLAGKHCESSDVIIRDALLPAPAAGDVVVDPGDRRLRLRDGVQLQRRHRARRSCSSPTATPARSSAVRPTPT